MESLASRLDLLGYPRARELELSAASAAEVATCVAFLEDRHVRALPPDERHALRHAGPAFASALDAYLRRLACPLPAAAPVGERLCWLAQHALALAYEDGAADFNAAATAEVAAAGAVGLPADAQTVVLTPSSALSPASSLPADAQPLLAELARLLHVRADGRDAAQVLQDVHRVVRMRVLPALAELDDAAAGRGSGGGGGGSARAHSQAATVAAAGSEDPLEGFGAGFATGSAALDRAATILRMLYVADLRDLQDSVSEVLVEVQSCTADPRTDASLGVVGR